MSSLIFCLMGPTASGKTDLAVYLHRFFPVDIISVDSVMVYRGMDIGSAKPDARILAEAPHHLIDVCEPYESYSAARFCEDALSVIQRVQAAGRIPLLTGGTMLYFHALQQGLSVLPGADSGLRAELLVRAAKEGWLALHAELANLDPVAAARIHPHDSQRIQRALEVFYLSGRSISAQQTRRKNNLGDAVVCNIVLAPCDRERLHQRIARRFRQMLQEGLVAEVRHLLQDARITPDLPSLRSAGYRQVCMYLSGELTEAEMLERGIIATRQLAKRQLTWLRRWPAAQWYDSERPDTAEKVAIFLEQWMKKFSII